MNTLLISAEIRGKVQAAQKRLSDANMAVGRDDKGAALKIIESVAQLLFEAGEIIEDGKPLTE